MRGLFHLAASMQSSDPDLTFSSNYQDQPGLPIHHNPPSYPNMDTLPSEPSALDPRTGAASRRRPLVSKSEGSFESEPVDLTDPKEGEKSGRMRRERPAFKPPAKNWVSVLSLPGFVQTPSNSRIHIRSTERMGGQ